MKKQLHPGARWMSRVNVFWTMIFILIILGSVAIPLIFEMNKDIGTGSLIKMIIYGAIFLTVLILILGEIWVRMAYNRWFYEFTDNNLKLERGVIWKRYSNVPYERIQNVDITRGIIARIIGFSTVNIQTAGYSASSGKGIHSEGYIPAVDIKEAEKIRDFLMKKIGKRNKQGL